MTNFLENPITAVWSLMGDRRFLLFSVAAAFAIKAFLTYLLVKRGRAAKKFSAPLIVLLLVLIGGMVEDISWVIMLIRTLIKSEATRFPNFVVKVAWAFAVARYQALAIFIENFTQKKYKLTIIQKLFFVASFTFFLFFIFIALFNFNNPKLLATERNAITIVTIYDMLLMLSSLFVALFRLYKSSKIPKIIKSQLQILINCFVIPTILADLMQTYPFHYIIGVLTHSLPFVSLSTVALTIAIFYTARKVMGLRFLNLDKYIRQYKAIYLDFMKHFKVLIKQSRGINSERALVIITQNFFNDAFSIPTEKVHVYIRSSGIIEEPPEPVREPDPREVLVERFLFKHTRQTPIGKFFEKNKVVVTDELSLTNFYDHSNDQEQILSFLNSIEADMFILIYEQDSINGYVIIERDSRIDNTRKQGEFYSKIECDHIEVLAAYLGNTIYFLQSQSMEFVKGENKELKEELYNKHQKIINYREVISKLLQDDSKKVGMMQHKTRQFIFCDSASKKLVGVDPNEYLGNPIVQALKMIVKQVLRYKDTQTCFAQDNEGRIVVITAFPSKAERNNHVTIFLHYEDISETLKKKVDLLADSSKWDYILCLETTEPGQLINKLAPSSSPKILNFKIDLLKIALSKKAILLDLPEEDLKSTVKILHKISLRKKIHTINLLESIKNSDEIAIKLFGTNPLFGISSPEPPILESLNKVGTLFIKNVHFLSIEIQKYLAELLKRGYYSKFKTDQKVSCDVRIICSTDQDLDEMVKKGLFSKELFNELRKTKLTLPPLSNFPQEELQELVTGITNQKLKKSVVKNILQPSDKERENLICATRLGNSLYDLKRRIDLLIEKKARENDISDISYIVDDANFLDGESKKLTEAMQMGKTALKNKAIMKFMLDTLKNQNRIAIVLKVTPSCVNRRLKAHGLIP